MQLIKNVSVSLICLILVSCVTINIYFPAAAAEKAADRIIEDVWGGELPTDNTSQSKSNDDKQSLYSTKAQPIAMQVLNWLISPAVADIDLTINTSASNALQAKMRQRHNSLKPYYDNGAIGLTENGFISIRDPKAIALKDRNTINALVSEENNDRNALYAEIARANGHPEWKDDIQATFARRWVSNAASGWWYQSYGAWKQK